MKKRQQIQDQRGAKLRWKERKREETKESKWTISNIKAIVPTTRAFTGYLGHHK